MTWTQTPWLLLSILLLTMPVAGCKGSRTADPGDATPAAAEPGASVLLITLDTTRADRLGCYSQEHESTPHLDSLAADGVMFRRAFAHTPLTIPSHVTIFTGQYPDRHGVRDNGDQLLSDEAVTLAERFDAAGYDTAAAVGAYVTNRKWGFGQGFDAYFDHIDTNYERGRNTWRSERRGDEVVEDLATWLEGETERPFFAWLHLFDPHDPYEPPEPFASQFPDQPYRGEIAYTDSQVGVLLEKLETLGIRERTHIVVVGDHGESFGNHGEWHHGIFVYNSTTHVPFLISPAGKLAAPVVIEEPVGLIDVAPTILALAGVEIDDAGSFDGIDLSPGLQGTEPARRILYGESMHVRYHFGWSEQRVAIEWPHKYIESTRPELFDIESDPAEHQNRLEDQTEVAQRLAGWLSEREPQTTSATIGDVDPEMARRLGVLGYVTALVEPADGQALHDPKDKITVLQDTTRANALMRRKEYGKARVLLEQVVAEEPELIDARVSLANACASDGEYELALSHLDTAEELSPRSTNILGMQASVLVTLDRVDDALAKLDEALQVDPKEIRTWDQILQALFETRRYPEALSMSERALAEIPEAPFVHGYRGAALVATGQLDLARPEIEIALSGGNTPPWAHFAMGVIESADGDEEASLTHFLAEYGAHPEHNEALAAAVQQMIRTGRNEEAIEHAALCLAADSGQPRMLWAEGQAHFNLQRYDEAAAAVDRCLAQAPDDAECVLLQANVLAKQGHQVQADAAFERSLLLAKEQHPGAQVEGFRLR